MVWSTPLASWVSCLNCILSSFLAHPQPTFWGDSGMKDKALMLCKYCSVIAKILVCFQQCFHHKSKTQHHMGCYEESELIPARSSKAINMHIYFMVLIYRFDSVHSHVAVADKFRLKRVSCSARQNRAPLNAKRRDSSLKFGLHFFFCSL